MKDIIPLPLRLNFPPHKIVRITRQEDDEWQKVAKHLEGPPEDEGVFLSTCLRESGCLCDTVRRVLRRWRFVVLMLYLTLLCMKLLLTYLHMFCVHVCACVHGAFRAYFLPRGVQRTKCFHISADSSTQRRTGWRSGV